MRATQPHPLPAAEASGVSHASSDPLEEQRVTATREGGFRTAGASPRAVGSGAASPPVQPAASWDCGAGGLVVARASFVSHQAQQWFLGGPPKDRPCWAGEGPLGPRPLGRVGPMLGCCPQPRVHPRAPPGGPRRSGQCLEQQRCFLQDCPSVHLSGSARFGAVLLVVHAL